jgi:hypothetical protein
VNCYKSKVELPSSPPITIDDSPKKDEILINNDLSTNSTARYGSMK